MGVFSRLGFICSASGPTTVPTRADRRTDLARDVLAEIAALGPSQERCKMWSTLETIEPSLRAGVEKALAIKEIPAAAIAKWLRSEGLPVSDNTVLRHRKEMCACRQTT